MNRKELAQVVRDRIGLTQKAAEDTVDVAFEAITTAMRDGDKVSIPGFGTFAAKDKPERKARNPQTGEQITVPARRVATFKPANALSGTLNS